MPRVAKHQKSVICMKNNEESFFVLYRHTMKKILLITLGCISVIVGTLGIILPGLPTTPLLLLAAWCFAQSSDKFHNWLCEHKILGKYIREYQKTGGVRLSIKIIAISFMWAGFGLAFLKVENTIAIAVIASSVIFATILLTLIIPTVSRDNR